MSSILKPSPRNRPQRAWLPALLLSAVLSAAAQEKIDNDVVALEKFIARETAIDRSGNILPTSRPVDSVLGPGVSVLDIPRAVTVITPELIRRFGIEGLRDLDRLGAGTQAANFFGIPGTPYLRGAKAGTFFNGMLRAYQRNEMPLSFGSLEALDVVKGPAPAHFGPTLEGGYVNFIPKSPYFDKTRGSVAVTAGAYDHHRMQIDYGGPALLARRPAAWRVSLAAQDAGTYWHNVNNDYLSAYAALKVQLREGLNLFSGAEYYDFKSNENPGWNRVTQDLIDRGEYIIGEPQDITSAAWGGFADRSLVEFPGSVVGQAPNFRALIVPAAAAEARIPPGLLALLEDRRAADGGYRYTDAYFDAGGRPLAVKIDGATVLSDPRDFANSRDFLWFLDLVSTRHPGRTVTHKALLEWLDTGKHSSYGYAIATKQLVFENKLIVEERLRGPAATRLTWGASLRYSYGHTVQDFFAEPFNRRDITRPAISNNSVVPAGAQRGPDGRNLWSTSVGANFESDLWQAAAFAYARTTWSDRLATVISLRAEGTRYESDIPKEVDRVSPAFRQANEKSGGRNFGSFAFSPVITVAPGVNLYATAQQGVSLQPAQGGTVNSESNFNETELYEGGAKFSLLDGRLFAGMAGFYWDSARFNTRENAAERLRGKGAEIEFTWAVSDRFSVIASFGAQRVQRRDPVGFRSLPEDQRRVAMEAGSFDAGVRAPAGNPGLVYPGTPEVQAKLNVAYAFAGGLALSLGSAWSDTYYHNWDRTLVLPSTVVWHAGVSWRRGPFEARVNVQNLFNKDSFNGADPIFSHNNLLTKAPPANGRATATWRF